MKQFAESIIRIEKYNKNNNVYKLTFDSTTHISTVDLNDKAYKSLMAYRDVFHCSNITDVFVQDDASSKIINSNYNSNNNSNNGYIKGGKHLKHIYLRHQVLLRLNDLSIILESFNYRSIMYVIIVNY